MQAITTRIMPTTNTRQTRVQARAGAGVITVPWDYELNGEENHAAVLGKLLTVLDERGGGDGAGWRGDWVRGDLHDGTVVWVNSGSKVTQRVAFSLAS